MDEVLLAFSPVPGDTSGDPKFVGVPLFVPLLIDEEEFDPVVDVSGGEEASEEMILAFPELEMIDVGGVAVSGSTTTVP